MSAPRVLVVEEEPRVGRTLEIILSSAGYAVEAARTWFDVLARVLVNPPGALLIDLAELDGRGVELCAEVRRMSTVGILVLSAVGEEHKRVRALDAGADDFVVRPFDVDQLLARLRAVLREPDELEDGTRLSVGGLLIDVQGRRVAHGGKDVPLTALEFEVLHLLARRHGRVVTDRQLMRAVWGPERAHDSGELRVVVATIRAKLERDPARPEYLISEPGVGYRLTGGS